MGEPAELSADERKRLFAFAEAVVVSVDADNEQPTPTWPDGSSMDTETIIFKLSQLVLALRSALEFE